MNKTSISSKSKSIKVLVNKIIRSLNILELLCGTSYTFKIVYADNKCVDRISLTEDNCLDLFERLELIKSIVEDINNINML